jgi:inorganic pyrophosphatase
MPNLLKIPTWADEEHVYAVVETPRGSTVKLDFDPKLRLFTLAKPLMAGLAYPYDWGFIPSTKGGRWRSARRSGDPRCADLSWGGPSVQAHRDPRGRADVEG